MKLSIKYYLLRPTLNNNPGGSRWQEGPLYVNLCEILPREANYLNF